MNTFIKGTPGPETFSALSRANYLGMIGFPLTLLAGWLPWKPELADYQGVSLIVVFTLLAFLHWQARKAFFEDGITKMKYTPFNIATGLFVVVGNVFSIGFLAFLILYGIVMFVKYQWLLVSLY